MEVIYESFLYTERGKMSCKRSVLVINWLKERRDIYSLNLWEPLQSLTLWFSTCYNLENLSSYILAFTYNKCINKRSKRFWVEKRRHSTCYNERIVFSSIQAPERNL